jgi:hypothetical protein
LAPSGTVVAVAPFCVVPPALTPVPVVPFAGAVVAVVDPVPAVPPIPPVWVRVSCTTSWVGATVGTSTAIVKKATMRSANGP